MAKKYKEEMMRLYSKSSSKSAPSAADEFVPKTAPTKPTKPSKPSAPQRQAPPLQTLPTTPPLMGEAEPKKTTQSPVQSGGASAKGAKPKFPTAEELLAAAKNGSSSGNAEQNGDLSENRSRGNYGGYKFLPYGEQGSGSFPYLYDSGSADGENPSPMTGTGYITVEAATGGGAVPIEGATVIISRKENGKNILVRMLTTDESGATETIPLPTPDISYSEAPDPSEKPYADYYVNAYAKGFYTIPELTVPVFSTVKSIQPISMIPLGEFSLNGDSAPNGASPNGAPTENGSNESNS